MGGRWYSLVNVSKRGKFATVFGRNKGSQTIAEECLLILSKQRRWERKEPINHKQASGIQALAGAKGEPQAVTKKTQWL